MEKPFEILEHTADLRIKALGKSLLELFLNMAKGMMWVLKNNLDSVPLKISRTISVSSLDRETLLIDFLSELLTTADTHNEVYPLIEITNISEKEITAKVSGDRVEGFDEDIKAVTYHGLAIKKQNDLLEAVVIFDI